ncbi:MAG: DUF4180 domain-containing protein [Bacteroidales bacterium]|nr:DUF4180 domain-containing protein [Bacteroidales bacterium]
MNIEQINYQGKEIAVVTDTKKIITDVQSALDLVMSVKYNTSTSKIAIDKALISDDFFVLSTGIAGEILQKFINYNVQVAIFGDFSVYTSKPLRDFIYESNKGRHFFFVATKQEALECLCKI